MVASIVETVGQINEYSETETTGCASNTSHLEPLQEGFEGVEKRLVLHFFPKVIASTNARSLRNITEAEWSSLLEPTGCQILSKIENPSHAHILSGAHGIESTLFEDSACVAYILSESSFFVYDYSINLKTCGSTTPLRIISLLCDFLHIPITEASVQVFMFSHFDYQFPQKQLYPHGSVSDEIEYLSQYFPNHEYARLATAKNQDYFVFLYKARGVKSVATVGPQYNGGKEEYITLVEVLMNGISSESVSVFAGMEGSSTEGKCSRRGALGALMDTLPEGSQLGEHWFRPHGYSCNILGESGKYVNIHISPEVGVSYGSIETTFSLTNLAEWSKWFEAKTLHVMHIRLYLTKQSVDGIFCVNEGAHEGVTDTLSDYRLVRRLQNEGSWYTVVHAEYAQHPSRCQPIVVASCSMEKRVPLISDYQNMCSKLLLNEEDQWQLGISTIGRLYALLMRYNGSIYESAGNGKKNIRGVFLSKIGGATMDRSLMIVDMRAVLDQWMRWKRELPSILPYYAVKCNNDRFLLECLGILGAGFDCATKNEICLVMNVMKQYPDFTSARIAYSHPCKLVSELQWCCEAGVRFTVLDNTDEAIKIAETYANAQVLLRIRVNDTKSQCPMSTKFGSPAASWRELFTLCKKLNIDLRGVTFHVGSGCGSYGSFKSALRIAKAAFRLAKSFGYSFNILDVGGGYPGETGTVIGHPSFEELAAEIRSSLTEYFGNMNGLTVISEPGRYFASASHVLGTKVFARRIPQKQKIYSCYDAEVENIIALESADLEESTASSFHSSESFIGNNALVLSMTDAGTTVASEDSECQHTPMLVHSEAVDVEDNKKADDQFWLYINESLYSVFNCMLYDHATPIPELLFPSYEDFESVGDYYIEIGDVLGKHLAGDGGRDAVGTESKYRLKSCRSTIFGQTCDGFDWLYASVDMPELLVGDWLMFRNIGAYTASAASPFNGFPEPLTTYAYLAGT